MNVATPLPRQRSKLLIAIPALNEEESIEAIKPAPRTVATPL
jgi:hypothetical protein